MKNGSVKLFLTNSVHFIMLFLILRERLPMFNASFPLHQLLPFTYAFSLVSFGFVFYQTIISSPSFRLWESFSEDNTRPVMLQRLTGVLFFGLIPVIVFVFFLREDIGSYGIKRPGVSSFVWTLLLSLIIIPMNYFNSRKPDNLGQYPQIRKKDWSINLLILSSISWIAYLFAYEMLFRGFLLFASFSLLGTFPAIIINTGLYSLAHIPKGMKETLGAIPFGILISYLTLKSGSFWIAFFVHIVLALSNEWFSIMAHPDIKIKTIS